MLCAREYERIVKTLRARIPEGIAISLNQQLINIGCKQGPISYRTSVQKNQDFLISNFFVQLSLGCIKMSSRVFIAPRYLCSKSFSKVLPQTVQKSEVTNQIRQLATIQRNNELLLSNMIFKNCFINSLPRKQCSSVLSSWNKNALSSKGQQQPQQMKATSLHLIYQL